MNITLDDCFVVYVRERKADPNRPNRTVERKLVSCGSYHEAEMVRRENRSPDRHCIIRYAGPAGGGD